MTPAIAYSGREYRHLDHLGLTLAVEVKDNYASVTLAICHPENDRYLRRVGRNLANLRLDGDAATLQALGLKKNLYSFPYEGKKPRQEILTPLLSKIKEQFPKRDHQWSQKVIRLVEVETRTACRNYFLKKKDPSRRKSSE